MHHLAALAILFLAPQKDEKAPHPGVNQAKVDQAIKKGEKWLLDKSHKKEYTVNKHETRSHELVLYTLLHSGADPNHPTFQKLLKEMLGPELKRTYNVSLQAMVLEKFNPKQYQHRIAQCCQYLVDNQCSNGQWSYGDVVKLPPTTPSVAPVKTSGSGAVRHFGPNQPGQTVLKSSKIVRISRKRKGPPTGDNSNTQYAALGLRACMEAGVYPPSSTLVLALKHWETDQNRDGGWGYKKGDKSWGSMTAGAIASVVIYRHHLKAGWKGAPSVRGGVGWMAKNFTEKENPGNKSKTHWYYYYMYAVERVGILADQERFGSHDWYLKGAEKLLATQSSNGSWPKKAKKSYTDQDVWDTCFAILFLARATRPMVASGGGRH